MSDGHQVLIPPADKIGPATCCCGWESTAETGRARIEQSDAHMYEHYSVFVQAEDENGVTVSQWGVA